MRKDRKKLHCSQWWERIYSKRKAIECVVLERAEVGSNYMQPVHSNFDWCLVGISPAHYIFYSCLAFELSLKGTAADSISVCAMSSLSQVPPDFELLCAHTHIHIGEGYNGPSRLWRKGCAPETRQLFRRWVPSDPLYHQVLLIVW